MYNIKQYVKILLILNIVIIYNILYIFIEPYYSFEIYYQNIWLWCMNIISLSFICFNTLIYNTNIMQIMMILLILSWCISEFYTMIKYKNKLSTDTYTMDLSSLCLALFFIIFIIKN